MWNTFKCTVLTLMREKSIVIWVVLFPVMLSTIFNAMFTGIDEAAESFDPVPVAVVDGSQGGAGAAFDEMMGVLAGDEALLAPVYVDSQDEARELLRAGKVVGTVRLDEDGWPHLEMSPAAGSATISSGAIERTILADVIDNFTRTRTAYEDIAAENPAFFAAALLADGGADLDSVRDLAEMRSFTERVPVTHSKAVESVRYFYALLGFSALMAAMVGLQAVGRMQANISPLGARRMVSGTSRARMLAGSIAGSWVLSFAGLMIGFVYMRFVLGVDFGGREAACILGIAVASLMSTSLGAFMGALPGIPFDAKGGLLSGITCLCSLFAGLYGQPAMNLADEIARNAPVLAAINPAKQVSDLFYSLYVYSDLVPFFQTIGILLLITVVLALVAEFFMRRQSHAHL